MACFIVSVFPIPLTDEAKTKTRKTASSESPNRETVPEDLSFFRPHQYNRDHRVQHEGVAMTVEVEALFFMTVFSHADIRKIDALHFLTISFVREIT